jgi:hypothetical protein
MSEIGRSLFTFGIDERPWDRAHYTSGREKFAFYTARDFEPDSWKALYPNPAFLRMTERDAAWMARQIARFSVDDIRRVVRLGQWRDDGDVEYLTKILVIRQRDILRRYFAHLSPLGEVHAAGTDQICATDFARLREVSPAQTFRYTVVERGDGKAVPLTPEVGDDGSVCFRTQPVIMGSVGDADPARRVTFEVRNGTSAGPLLIHTYDLGSRGMHVVGLTRAND